MMNEDLLLSLKRESENYPRMRNCGDSTTCNGKFHVRFFPGNVWLEILNFGLAWGLCCGRRRFMRNRDSRG